MSNNDDSKLKNEWSTRFLETIVSLAERMNIAPAELLVSGFVKRARQELRRRSRPVSDEYAEAQCKAADTDPGRSRLHDIVDDLSKGGGDSK